MSDWPPAGIKWYYSDDAVCIAHGDCREILPLLPKVDIVLTDPPYGAQTHAGAQTQTGGRSRKLINFESITPEELAKIIDGIKPHRWAVMTCDWQHVLPLKILCMEMEFVRMGIWAKPDGCPQFTGDRPSMGWEAIAMFHGKETKKRWNGGGRSSVWIMNVWRGNLHPTQKPEDLLISWVELFSEAGETILDPFMGSGTTLRVAKDLGRRAIGIERDEYHCDVAAKRMAQEVLVM